ncbi:helix-turn-helix transcriptional regulator [Skermania sp. ID1734]|uniref:helix-turn-helix domain-containing protein n=1 Tax=Skermania sp. ID1734 TaxID=2597516 RepID=UPI00117FECE0|nr:helix-turn-helix transcriptional regulator [Skermania sp. ID1734]TSD94065.1 helix-turn-helix transcriptional regulator [Skermania sp. ID1734]
MLNEPDQHAKLLGEFIRAQRQMANLSLRQLSAMTAVSNPYLSQIERGMHQPSVRVLKSIASALNLSAEAMLEQAGLLEETGPAADSAADDGNATENALNADKRLTPTQKRALISVYRSYIEANESGSS